MSRERPYTLIAELTYRCPLRCSYCSNPTQPSSHAEQLDTAAWIRAFDEAEALGVVQLHLTGGEPLLRTDLELLIAAARRLDLYTQLVSSGVPLERARLGHLRDAGLDAVQLSLQSDRAAENDAIAGRPSFTHKLAVARWVKELGLPLTLNVVLHRHNLDRVPELVALAERLGADRLELANAQYLGWALTHRSLLLPTHEQLGRAREAAAAARERLRGRMEIVFVLPDYYAGRPRACMDGWGRRYLVISPEGLVLPCQAAHTIPTLHFARVGERPLAEIWERSEVFECFRGTDWMSAPCRDCPERERDFGGCRCQAYHLTGDAAAPDPSCQLVPSHHLVAEAVDAAERSDPGPLIAAPHLTKGPVRKSAPTPEG